MLCKVDPGTVEPLGSGNGKGPFHAAVFNEGAHDIQDLKNNVGDDAVKYDDQTYCCIRRKPCEASDL